MRMDLTLDRLQRASAVQGDLVPLAGGLPDASLFPRASLHAAFGRAMSDPSTGLQYDWPEGSEPLREWIAARLRARGMDVTAGDVIVTSGAQQALAIVTSLLVRPIDAVAVDDHCYPAALDLFRKAGATLVSPDANATCAFHYVMPGAANPTGQPLGAARIDQLLVSDAPIVADEAYAELRFDGVLPTALAALEPGRVWHVGSFSKTLCPGLRVGYLVPPRRAHEAALEAKRDADLQAGTLSQSVLAHLLAVGDYDARLARARQVYRTRAERLQEALHRELPRSFRFREPEGGFSIWVESDEEGDDVALLRTAAAYGVSFDPGHLFARESSSRLAFRVCFSSAPIDALAEGARRLGRAIARMRGSREAAA
jgi:2-aminoadipate transaminase